MEAEKEEKKQLEWEKNISYASDKQKEIPWNGLGLSQFKSLILNARAKSSTTAPSK